MADIVCHVQSLPSAGAGAVANQRSISLGGTAFNQANIIRQLGQPGFLFAPLGQGIFADFIRQELAERHIKVLDVQSKQDCGACICLVEPNGERTLLTLPGLERNYQAEWFDNIDAGRFSSALISGYEIEGAGGDVIINFLEQHPDIELVYAPGPSICNVGAEKTGRINALNPIWHLNDLEAINYTKASTLAKAGSIIQTQCNNLVIITEGARGSSLFSNKGRLFAPTQEVRPVDTIGAGDAHVGCVIAARNAGLDWQDALEIANRISGALCGIAGATFTDEEFAQLGIRLGH
ncbi:sugar kinase [Actinomycetota bacterium]|nr:sugar kinase [Actinomycetota bacterium]